MSRLDNAQGRTVEEMERMIFDASIALPEGYTRSSIFWNGIRPYLTVAGDGVPAMWWDGERWNRMLGGKPDA
jgi:hypothetical protein